MTAHLVIFEPEAAGHRANYLNDLIGYAACNKTVGRVTFVLSPALLDRLEPVSRVALDQNAPRLAMRLLSEAELSTVGGHKPTVRRSFARWNMAHRIVRECDASHLHFTSMDDVLTALAFVPSTLLRISGIYFRPTNHLHEYRRGLGGLARQVAKGSVVQRVLNRTDTISLLSLDPLYRDFARDRYANGAKVGVLPPEPVVAVSESGPTRRASRSDPVRFLTFGALQRRKGIAQLMDAMELLDDEAIRSACFVICGEGELSDLITLRAMAFRARGGNLAFENRFLGEHELRTAILSSDIFLAPYQNHIGSSGMLYAAAMYRRPVITQCQGLVGAQVFRYRLGEAVDTSQPAEIANAIRRAIRKARSGEHTDQSDYDGFLSSHGSRDFAKTVYANALGDA